MAAPILYLTHRVPHPPNRGDRIRNWHLLQFLAHRHPVWLACLADEPVPTESDDILRKLCSRVEIVPVHMTRWFHGAFSLVRGQSISEGVFQSTRLRRVVEGWCGEVRFRAAVVSASSLVPYLELPELRHTPKIVDLVDVDSQKWLDYAATMKPPRSWLFALEGRRLRKVESRLPYWVDAVLLVSAAETDLYRSFALPGPGRIETVTNGVDLNYFQPQAVEVEPACTFVGALDYPPNVDAAVWFATTVWPGLHSSRPELRFRLVGRAPVAEVQALAARPGVEVIGSVPDVRPWIARSSVIVVPLRIARGLQNKVLEALAMAKACVASPAALAGVKARPEAELLAASGPEQWQAAIIRLLDDPERRRSLGLAGRQYVETHHSWEACLRPVQEILSSVKVV
ncbi:MAG: TIGR03087 family PEP-CTERM/XrtA system glycosyltransferase [Gemmataceae bacterium]|nr:TIGR03087 family PEP-CTERM/XrtA system glycosyltransferase [Gemmataceae bacterium]